MKIFITPLDDKSRQTDMIKLGRTSKFHGNDAALNAVIFLIEKYQVPLETITKKIEEHMKLNENSKGSSISIQNSAKTAIAE